MGEPIDFDYQVLPLAIEADPKTTERLRGFFEKHPALEAQETNITYHIQIVEPDPHIDYKILTVVPDPNIDYKIRIIEPKHRQKSIQLGSTFSEELADFLKGKDAESHLIHTEDGQIVRIHGKG